MKRLIKVALLFLVLLFLLYIEGESFRSEDGLVTIYCREALESVNKNIFGANLLAFDPSLHNQGIKYPYYGHADYGAGIWDPNKNMPVGEPVSLAINAGIKMFRFPGGCGSHLYDWKKAIGKNREHYLFGIDEFLKVCQAAGAEPVFTISFFTGNEQDAADLVEYLNSPNDGSNPNVGTDWAKIRAENGHPQPYGVRYFEIGNEIYHGNHLNIKKVSAEEYAQQYLKYYMAMKAISASVKIGAVLFYPDWNRRIIEIIRENIDFGIVHLYPPQPGANKQTLGSVNPNDLFKISLALPSLREEYYLLDTLRVIRNNGGRDVSLAVTEYNGGFAQAKPYLYSLGNALMNAELLRIFMEPQYHILMAHHWNFLNEFWGMIANGFSGKPEELYGSYYKRPAYYVYELYNNHFGDILLNYDINAESYDISKFPGINKLFAIPGLKYGFDTPAVSYLSVNASKSTNGEKVYLMVINKNMDMPMTVTIDLKDFAPTVKGNVWVLNGPSVDATNEDKYDNVKITHSELKVENNPFKFTFEPHSLTAIEIEKAI